MSENRLFWFEGESVVLGEREREDWRDDFRVRLCGFDGSCFLFMNVQVLCDVVE